MIETADPVYDAFPGPDQDLARSLSSLMSWPPNFAAITPKQVTAISTGSLLPHPHLLCLILITRTT
jgi:hypothetical protein